MGRSVQPRGNLTITNSLPPEKEKLRECAARSGEDVTGYVQRLIEKHGDAQPMVSEALAPFRRQVAESGMSDAELETFFEEVREEVWQERQADPGKAP
jgi:hypothetical protein